MKLNITRPMQVEAKTLKIHMKVRDSFSAQLVDQEGQLIHDQEDGYVPGFMPGDHYGDYLILDIDIDTGQVVNWKRPSAAQLEEWIGGEE